MSSIEFLVLISLTFISGFLSASEVALFSLSRFQLRSLKDRFPNSHKLIKKLLSDPGGLLVSILVITEVVNVSITTLITSNLVHTDNGDWFWHSLKGTLITAPIVLFLCEITPKIMGARASQIVAPLTVKPLSWVYSLLFPARWLLTRGIHVVTHVMDKTERGADLHQKAPLKEEEFLTLIEEGHKEGAIHESELGLVRNVFELDDTQCSEVFTPLDHVMMLPHNTPLETAFGEIKNKRYSRIPVYEGAKKNIIGFLYAKDLLLARLDEPNPNGTIEPILRKPLTVTPDIKLNALFRRLKKSRTHIAVVESKSAGAIGIITMNDVLQALFEDLTVDKGAE